MLWNSVTIWPSDLKEHQHVVIIIWTTYAQYWIYIEVTLYFLHQEVFYLGLFSDGHVLNYNHSGAAVFDVPLENWDPSMWLLKWVSDTAAGYGRLTMIAMFSMYCLLDIKCWWIVTALGKHTMAAFTSAALVLATVVPALGKAL